MEQRDYILREIEKIGLMLNAIRQKIFGGHDNLSINIEKQVDDVIGMLKDEASFDLDHFLNLKDDEATKFIENNIGFNVENIDLLASCISQIGLNKSTNISDLYFKKALLLYELSNTKSKTYSMDRENRILDIKNILKKSYP